MASIFNRTVYPGQCVKIINPEGDDRIGMIFSVVSQQSPLALSIAGNILNFITRDAHPKLKPCDYCPNCCLLIPKFWTFLDGPGQWVTVHDKNSSDKNSRHLGKITEVSKEGKMYTVHFLNGEDRKFATSDLYNDMPESDRQEFVLLDPADWDFLEPFKGPFIHPGIGVRVDFPADDCRRLGTITKVLADHRLYTVNFSLGSDRDEITFALSYVFPFVPQNGSYRVFDILRWEILEDPGQWVRVFFQESESWFLGQITQISRSGRKFRVAFLDNETWDFATPELYELIPAEKRAEYGLLNPYYWKYLDKEPTESEYPEYAEYQKRLRLEESKNAVLEDAKEAKEDPEDEYDLEEDDEAPPPPVVRHRGQRKRPILRKRRPPKRLRVRRSWNIARRIAELPDTHCLGEMNVQCSACHAFHFPEETAVDKEKQFGSCCCRGNVVLPLMPPIPDALNSLLDNRKEMRNIRAYNSILSFASVGANIDQSLIQNGVYTYRMHGSMYHVHGSLIPASGKPKFAQLYFYDAEHELANRQNIMKGLNPDLLEQLQNMIHANNRFFSQLTLNLAAFEESKDIYMELVSDDPQDAPNVPEVCAIIPHGGKYSSHRRDIRVKLSPSDEIISISQTHPDYDVLAYVLLFPHGNPRGWTFSMPHSRDKDQITPREFAAFRLHTRFDETNILHRSGKLFHQYIVDQYAKMEEERLTFIRRNQTKLRSSLYSGILDALNNGQTRGMVIGQRCILPRSYVGSARYYNSLYQDAMAIVREFGRPDLFITMTCNPEWPEIKREIISPQQTMDRPDLTARVFSLKLKELLSDLITKDVLGVVIGYIFRVEFQKRGLSHAHILLILQDTDKPRTAEDINSMVSAELPDDDTDLLTIVKKTMMHGPCGDKTVGDKMPLCCAKNGRCCKRFPKDYRDTTALEEDGYPQYRRRNTGRKVSIRSAELDNAWVVPYNAYLLKKYNCHINVEICSSIRCIKYVYKYVYKDSDMSTLRLTNPLDEVSQYLSGRVVSAIECCYRIFSLTLHQEKPVIVTLPIHEPNGQTVLFGPDEDLRDVLARGVPETALNAYFRLNETNAGARNFVYSQIPMNYTYDKKGWKPRKNQQSYPTIGRMRMVRPSEGEAYYMRILLTCVKGATSFEDLRTVDGTVADTYKEACSLLGLLDDDTEWVHAMAEAASSMMAGQLRYFFAMLLVHCEIRLPEQLWITYFKEMSDDISHRSPALSPEVGLSDTNLFALILLINTQDLEHETAERLDTILLRMNNSSIGDFIPRLAMQRRQPHEEVVRQQTDPSGLPNQESMLEACNDEQKAAVEQILEAVSQRENNEQGDCGNLIFLEGCGGSGKSFVFKTVLSTLRHQGKVAIAMAMSGIASLLFPGGGTLHYFTSTPLKLTEDMRCHLPAEGWRANLLKEACILMIDEVSMMDSRVLTCLDRSLKELMRSERPFGGKVIVLSGDFRQTLPVIRRASRGTIAAHTLPQSEPWPNFNIITLHTNMRLQCQKDPELMEAMKQYAEFLMDIGNGIYPTCPGSSIRIHLPDYLRTAKTMQEMLDFVYDGEIGGADYLQKRAILCPRNNQAQSINDIVGLRLHTESQTWTSLNTCSKSYVPNEFLNILELSSLPPHNLTLRIGTPIILIRTLDKSRGLCNGLRMVVTGSHRNSLLCKPFSDNNNADEVLIPRIALEASPVYVSLSYAYSVPFQATDTGLPFSIKRRQFPIRVAFAMTINKSQSQSLDRVGVFLPGDGVFSHGQLYVALSRVTSPDGIILYLPDDLNNERCTNNIVYTEALISDH